MLPYTDHRQAELNTPQDVITCKRKSLLGPEAVNPTLPQCIPMTEAELGLVSSIFTLGGFIGALGAGPISATRGRVLAMRLSAIFFTLGPVLEALAPSIAVLSIGRFLSGLGAGASVVVVPIYVSEVAPPAERGFFGSFTQVMVNLGIFVTQLLGYFLSYGQMWRIVLAVGGGIGLTLGLGLFTICESPKWLATHGGKGRKARDILQKIRGQKFDIDDEFSSWGVDASYEDIDDIDGEEAGLLGNADPSSPPVPQSKSKHEVVGMLEAATHPLYRKAVFAVIMVMIAQQLTGINSIIMYGVHLLSDLLASNSAILNLAVSALNIIVTILCAPLIDHLGRKSCLLASISGMGIASLLLAFGIQNSIPILSGVAVLLFVGSFGVGLGPIPFILAAELVGPEAVNATQSWALGANWISTFIVAQFFPMVNNALGSGVVYFLFAGIALFFAIFVGVYVPESKGKRNADEVWGRTSERID
jgi:MFS family permease